MKFQFLTYQIWFCLIEYVMHDYYIKCYHLEMKYEKE